MLINIRASAIEDFNEKIRKCKKCRLSETRINAICGEGNLDTRLIIVAQAPGVNEDREGKMFIGPSGKILDEMLTEVNILRREIYMTNLIKCMLPKYRKPKQDEIDICSDYLDKEIELINPPVIAPLGYYAIKYIFEKYGILLPSKPEFNTIIGKIFSADDRRIFPLRHPAAVLYNNSIREEMIKYYHKLKILLQGGGHVS